MEGNDKIKRYTITWFDRFECLAGKCPESCCRGWVIPLSPEDIERFKKERGLLGFALFLATGARIREKFNPGSRSCPFWRRDGLCTLQRKRGHDFIPWTCQSYPRFYRNFGDFEECCLDLSCIEAARLFIENRGSVDMSVTEADPVTRVCSTNDDRAYLDFLLSQRSAMSAAAGIAITDEICRKLFEYAKFLQNRFMSGACNNYGDMTFEVFLKHLAEDDALLLESGSGKASLFPLSPHILSGFLSSSLNHKRLRRTSPTLYKMLDRADRALARFIKVPGSWQLAADAKCRDNPHLPDILGQYLGYYLFQYFLRTYETYSFRKQVALGICHVNMIFLLAVTSKQDILTADDMARIIAAYNRRAYFNDIITDEMYRVFEDGIK
ncbi:MAG: flagellin lysine-N-methylase [Lachnospiraceae bacterium]|nr:flagellin lysine-N-methylase [Lachnospiraceae bacterium]